MNKQNLTDSDREMIRESLRNLKKTTSGTPLSQEEKEAIRKGLSAAPLRHTQMVMNQVDSMITKTQMLSHPKKKELVTVLEEEKMALFNTLSDLEKQQAKHLSQTTANGDKPWVDGYVTEFESVKNRTSKPFMDKYWDIYFSIETES